MKDANRMKGRTGQKQEICALVGAATELQVHDNLRSLPE